MLHEICVNDGVVAEHRQQRSGTSQYQYILQNIVDAIIHVVIHIIVRPAGPVFKCVSIVTPFSSFELAVRHFAA